MPDELGPDDLASTAKSRSRRCGSRGLTAGRATQPPAMSARYGAANDAWPARSIRRLQPRMKHSPLRGRRIGPKTLPTQHAVPAPDYGHRCCIPVAGRSWRRSSCSSSVQPVSCSSESTQPTTPMRRRDVKI